MEKLEEQIHSDLQQYLLSVNEVDERMPECPDVEGKWVAIANAYIPDGVREFQNYPLASLGWMMYIGMALAKMWDDDWQYYAAKEDLYVYLRDKRGYDERHHSQCAQYRCAYLADVATRNAQIDAQ